MNKKSKIFTDQTSVKCNVKLCSNNDVPPSSVIRTCLGPSLAQVFFDYTHHDTLKLLDVLITSKTSKPCFSIPPENQMTKNDVPPTDHQIIKAFVHQNILGNIINIIKYTRYNSNKNSNSNIF